MTIPFDKLGNAPADIGNAPVNAPADAPVNVPVNGTSTDSDDEKILKYCDAPRGILEIGSLLGLKDKRSIHKRINQLLEQGRIAMTVPDKPNSPNQKYITIK